MASIKSDPNLREVDKAIRRINTDLKRAAELFGVRSSQYQHLESKAASLLARAGASGRPRKVVNARGESVTQLPRTRAALLQWTGEQKMIRDIEKIDLKKQQHQMVERYAKSKGIPVPKTKAERLALFREVSDTHERLNVALSDKLELLYSLREITGDDTAIDQIRRLSRGQWTTAVSKEEMLRIADHAIMEQSDIIREYLDDRGLDDDTL